MDKLCFYTRRHRINSQIAQWNLALFLSPQQQQKGRTHSWCMCHVIIIYILYGNICDIFHGLQPIAKSFLSSFYCLSCVAYRLWFNACSLCHSLLPSAYSVFEPSSKGWVACGAPWGAGGGRGGSPKRLYKAPTDYTKPRQTIQSPKTLYKAQKYTKTVEY